MASPSAMMGRQIRAPLTNSFSNDQEIFYYSVPTATPIKARYLLQEGQNTALIMKAGTRTTTFAHFDQLKSIWGQDKNKL